MRSWALAQRATGPPYSGGVQVKRRIIVALCLCAVTAFAVAAATSEATNKSTASSITVWLQADAQSGWPTVVAAATTLAGVQAISETPAAANAAPGLRRASL